MEPEPEERHADRGKLLGIAVGAAFAAVGVGIGLIGGLLGTRRTQQDALVPSEMRRP